MNPNDLPPELTHEASNEALLAAVRQVAQGPLADVVDACDRDGFYPRDVLQQLGALGVFSAHRCQYALVPQSWELIPGRYRRRPNAVSLYCRNPAFRCISACHRTRPGYPAFRLAMIASHS